MSDPIFTLLYEAGAVVAIVPGTVARSGCQTATGTQAQLDAIRARLKLTPLPDPAFVAAAAAAQAARQKTFDATVAAGYTVPDVTPALVIGMDDATRAQFHQLSTLLTLQAGAGRIAASDQVAFLDRDGNARSLSAANVQTMIMGMDEAYFAAFTARHAS